MGGNNVKTGNPAYFSDAYLNPEKATANKKHTVLIDYVDPKTKLDYYLVGFEDLNRETASCDNDFNDCVFYATANPVEAINRTGIKPVISPLDTDGDGVCDALDEYPTDPTRAYNNHYPGVNQYGTLAFEDNWPVQGDYDMNDLVVSYHYNLITNAKNQVVEIKGDFAPIAAGASYENAFGVQLPFSNSVVSSVTGQKLANGFTKQNSNGTEAGQTNAVIIPFDGTMQLIKNPNGNTYVNTDPTIPKVTGDTSHLDIVLSSPQGNVDPATFNPFLISNKRRAYEVHLPGFEPTSLANKALLGTGDDASNAASGIYYVTKNNYPFAINFASSFSYPTERTPIYKAYLHFYDWTGSGGTNYLDWYKNTAAGYQNSSVIYNK
jgi:LruC domain-containing protein